MVFPVLVVYALFLLHAHSIVNAPVKGMHQQAPIAYVKILGASPVSAPSLSKKLIMDGSNNGPIFAICGQKKTELGLNDDDDDDKCSPIWQTCTGVIVVCNAVFRSTISCSSPEIFAIKSPNRVVENKFSARKFWGRRILRIRCRNFYSRTRQKRLPQFPQQTRRYKLKYTKFLDNFRILGVKNCWRQTIHDEVCISKRWSSIINCKIFRGKRALDPEIFIIIIIIAKSYNGPLRSSVTSSNLRSPYC